MLEIPSPTTVSHPSPQTAGKDRSAKWAEGITYAEFLPTATENVGLWEGVYKRAEIPQEILDRATSLPGNWKLLILSADWCGDASNIVPVLQKLVDEAPNLDLRLLDRDEHLDLMNEHLTGGIAEAIPAVIILDENYIEQAWWGPRPTELQAWFKSDEGQQHESEARYVELRKWYARDKGRTSMNEILTLIEGAYAALSVDAAATSTFPPIGSRDHVRGPENAEVTLIQYGDFECPQSRQVFVMVRGLMKAYPEQLRLVYRHFPVRTHPNALGAAEAAEAAASQGQFWAMHDHLFNNQLALSENELVKHAESIGIDAREVQTALAEQVFRGHVLTQKRGGVKGGVRSSLNVILEGKLYQDDAVMDAIGELDERLS